MIWVRLARPSLSHVRAVPLCSLPSSPFAVLGIKATATDVEIKNAYLAACKANHPDVSPGSGDSIKQITTAFRQIVEQRRPMENHPKRRTPAPARSQRATPPRAQAEEQQRAARQGERWMRQKTQQHDAAAVQRAAQQRYAEARRTQEEARAQKKQPSTAAAASEWQRAASAKAMARARRKAQRV